MKTITPYLLLLAATLLLTGCNDDTTSTTPHLPEGYTLEHYTIEEVLEVTCEQHSDCETPMEYLVQSRCPFTALCLDNSCTVVCPEYAGTIVQGIVTEQQTELDGLIVTLDDQGTTHTVLLSIPNLGPGSAETLSTIEEGTYLQAEGTTITIEEETWLVATKIYVEGSTPGEHPCNLEPDPGTCEAAITRYFYDQETNACEPFSWGGCDGTVPFDTREVCENTCIGLPERPLLTQERCEEDGGRVVNTLTETCSDDEISIGAVELLDCPCECCMPRGGSASTES